jgi:chromate transporter
MIRIGSKALKSPLLWGLATLAFVAIYFFKVPFPFIILASGLLGLIGGQQWPNQFPQVAGHGNDHPASEQSVLDDDSITPAHAHPSLARTLRMLIIGGGLWWLPIWLIGLALGWNHTLVKEALFFSKAALVTFGGAYAVLPYVSQQAVEHYHWLTAGQMLDGLGLAETTPGPLIMVLQFVGFVGGWNHPGHLSPLAAATLGAFITTWTTFVPCFLFIFIGAPYIEQLRGKKNLTTALSAVTAAVVGVVLNLAVWFGFHVLVPAGQTDWFAVVVAAVAFLGMTKWKWGVIPVVLGGGLLGLIYQAGSNL